LSSVHLFYSFDLDAVVPDDHLVREIAAVLDLNWVYSELARPQRSHILLGYLYRRSRYLLSQSMSPDPSHLNLRFAA